MTAYGGPVALVTITAPGADVLRWDRRPGPGGRRRVHPFSAAIWNRWAPANWRRLHRAAAQRARRRHGKLTLLGWSWEFQRRGVLHKHVILGVGSAVELAAAHTYVQALDELRHAHRFGFVDRGRKRRGTRSLEVVPALRAARYVAKYLAKRGDGDELVLSETVHHRDVPPLVVYVARAMTARTGITMRHLRHVRLAYVLAPRLDLDQAEALDLLGQGVKLWRMVPSHGP